MFRPSTLLSHLFLVFTTFVTLAKADDKLVFAHVVVGLNHNFTQDTWASEYALAQAKGIDGFALNIGNDDWQPTQVSNAYQAALNSNGFKLFLSFDMSSFPCQNSSDGDILRTYITGYAEHPNQVQVDGKMLISTFIGDNCTFGASSSDEGWLNTVKSNVPATYFIPNFNTDPQATGQLTSIDGNFDWVASWPLTDTNVSFATDQAYIDLLGNRRYMAGVSPWFFTHYSPQTFNKNYVYNMDDWQFINRWEQLIQNRDKLAFAQIVSWNDVTESHYVGPFNGMNPDGTTWDSGFDHQGWLDLQQYYITAFKTGSFPTIEDDRVFLWGRLYPSGASIPSDTIGKPNNAEWLEDKIWAVALLTAPATVELTCGDSKSSTDVQAGASKLVLNLDSSKSCSVSATIRRKNGHIDFNPDGFNFQADNLPSTYNYNAFVAASPANSKVSSAVLSKSFLLSWPMQMALYAIVAFFVSS
ncbi:glycoside hydrolase [Panus rudis PR-1116 ss-1]|nr:glycoside hydrolase [Panus rudis PR-1116 ss-1]